MANQCLVIMELMKDMGQLSAVNYSGIVKNVFKNILGGFYFASIACSREVYLDIPKCSFRILLFINLIFTSIFYESIVPYCRYYTNSQYSIVGIILEQYVNLEIKTINSKNKVNFISVVKYRIKNYPNQSSVYLVSYRPHSRASLFNSQNGCFFNTLKTISYLSYFICSFHK